MDVASTHLLYILASYGLAAFVLIILGIWVITQDRKVQRQLSKFHSDDT